MRKEIKNLLTIIFVTGIMVAVSAAVAVAAPSEDINSSFDVMEKRAGIEKNIQVHQSSASTTSIFEAMATDSNSAINNGISFLESSQNSDGSWPVGGYLGSFDSTCLALRTLAQAKINGYAVDSNTITKAITYIESSENPQAYALQGLIWSKKAGFTVNNTKIQNGVNYLSTLISSQAGGTELGNSIRALQLAKENGYTVSSTTLTNAITALESEQQLDGSWSNNSFPTTYAALALSETSSSPTSVQKAIDWVVQNQNTYSDGDLNGDGLNDEGSWSDSPHTGIPWMDDTSLGTQALVLKSVAPSKIDYAISWLLNTQKSDGAWDFHGDIGGNSVADATGYAIEALLKKSTGVSVSISLDKSDYSPSSNMWVEMTVKKGSALTDISSSDLNIYMDASSKTFLSFQKISTGVYKFKVIAPSTVGSHSIRADVSTSAGSGSGSASFTVSSVSVSINDIVFGSTYKLDDYKEPVYRRGDDKPKFTIKLSKSKSELPQDTKVWIYIYAPGKTAPVKSISLNSWGTSDVTSTNNWDWSGSWGDGDNDGTANEITDDIPVGIYKAKAKVLVDGAELATQENTFYVIFNFPKDKEGFITSPSGYEFFYYPEFRWNYHEKQYVLHQYDSEIWNEAIKQIDGTYEPRIASNKLNDFAHKIGGNGYNYDNDKDHHWYDVKKFLDEKSGQCVDFAGLMVSYSRGVGIPSRFIGGVGIEYDNETELYGHAWAENLIENNWIHYDPTQSYIDFKDKYAKRNGVEFRPIVKKKSGNDYAWVTARKGPSEVGNLDVENIFDYYTYCGDATDITFDKTDYNYGEQMQFTTKIKNTCKLNINTPIYLRLFDVPSIATIGVPHQIEDNQIANSLNVGQETTKDSTWTLPDFGWMNSVYESIGEREIKAIVYYKVGTKEVKTSVYSEKIPGLCIDQIPIMSINSDNFILSNYSSSSANASDMVSWKKTEYVVDNTSVLDIYSENEHSENYTKTILTLENNDYDSHIYTLTIPLAGKGDAVYIPTIGKFTANISGLSQDIDHFITYRQINETNDYISIYKFSRNGTVNDINIFEYDGAPVVQLNVSWDYSLDSGELKDTIVYFQRFDGENKPFSQIGNEFSSRVAINDTLADIEIDKTHEIKVNQTMELNLSIFNNGESDETNKFNITVSKVVAFVPYTVETIYINSTYLSLIHQTYNNFTYPIEIPDNASSGIWDISILTDKDMRAKTTVIVEDAFDIMANAPATANQNSLITVTAIINNSWNSTIHDATVELNHYHNFNTTESLVKSLGDFAPYENKTVSWVLNTTASGDLNLDVTITSADGGSDSNGTTIKALAQPSFNIFYDAKPITKDESFILNVTVENIGDLPAESVSLNITPPDGVTIASNVQSLGDISGKTNITTSFAITSNATDDFALLMNISSVQTSMEYPITVDVLVPGVELILYSPSEILLGESAVITGILNNTGELNLSGIPLQFNFDGASFTGNAIEYLDINISEVKSFVWTITPENADVYQIGANVTYEGLLAEKINPLTVTSIHLSVTTEKSTYNVSELVTFTTSITNENPYVSYSNLQLNASIIGPITDEIGKEIGGIDPSTTKLTYFTWTPPLAGVYSIETILNNSEGIMLDENLTSIIVTNDSEVPDSIVRGDVNGDGIISSVDAQMALQMSAGNIAQDLAADVNGDGSVTSLDALMILQASVGAIEL